MTPRRPAELVTASAACGEAWLKRDAMIEAGDTEGVKAMDLACAILDERYQTIYREWQILGGTSNIDSIALPLPTAHYEKDFTPIEDAFCDERLNKKETALDYWKNADGTWKPFKSWTSYPRRFSEPLSAEEVDDNLVGQ